MDGKECFSVFVIPFYLFGKHTNFLESFHSTFVQVIGQLRVRLRLRMLDGASRFVTA